MTVVPRDGPTVPGRIYVLNGASSSGKSSLSKVLQGMLQPAPMHLQLDTFRAMEPAGYWDATQPRAATTVALKFAALCRAMHAAVGEYARHGQSVIFDTVITRQDNWHFLFEDFANLPVYLIGVDCAVEELTRRELARGDREIGLAASQAAIVHADRVYDIRLDTTTSSAEQCAQAFARWLDSQPVPHAFSAMLSLAEVSSKET